MLILASQSPRRIELLGQLGVQFKQASADIDERVIDGERPSDYVLRLAEEKARAILTTLEEQTSWVLGADTTVVADGEILGKPTDFDDAKRILAKLSGAKHQVHTGVALVTNTHCYTVLVTTDVCMTEISITDIEQYWQTGEPQDKAGSYGIQGIGGKFVSEIHGSYSNVVGLPLVETAKLLKQADLIA